MNLSTEAALSITEPCGQGYGCELRQLCGECECTEEQVVHTDLTVHGSVWEPAGSDEYGVNVERVEGLPYRLELEDLDPLQLEACALALQYEYERLQRVHTRLPEELERLDATLRSALEQVPTLSGHLAAHERIGALTKAIEMAQAQLQSLRKEAA